MQDRKHKTGAPMSLEVAREDRERREARDRVLAREVGIEIGRRRERERQHRDKDKAWGRGFFVGLIVAAIFFFAGWYGAEKASAAEPVKTRIGSGADSSWAVYHLGQKTMPPGWRTFLRICQLEQPGDGWRGVWWTNTVNYSFLGGCGLTVANFSEVRHPAWPATANLLSARDQLWASFWLFWRYARIGQEMRGSYDGGQRYGSTVWDVHTQMGFDGFRSDGKTPA